MDHLSAERLERRLSGIERSTRRDRLIGLGVLALLFASAQAPAPPAAGPVTVRDAAGASATLSASGLVIRDAAGKTRAFAGIDSEGRPSFDLSDAKGTLRQTMFLLDGVPQLRQFDGAGTMRATMNLNSTSGDGEFDVRDDKEKIRLAVFRGGQSGNPEIALYGSDEKPRAYLATDDASPYLVMRDASGGTRVYVGGYTNGNIGIDIRNASNGTLWSAP
jgi:hypothetical protein